MNYGFAYDPHAWEDSFDLEADEFDPESHCEGCDQTVDYSDGSKHGTCGCDN